jgi:hypothetical protein
MYKYNSLTDIWSPVTAPVISSRQNAKGFSINGFGYLIGGANEITGINNYDFWQYDPVADSWTQKTSYPGQGSYSQMAFEMDNYGFVGGGAALPYSMNLTYSDFYRYDPSTDTWLAIVDFGGGIRNSACFLSFGNRAFAGLGSTGVYPVLGYQVDWWEMVTATDINENKNSINQAVVYSAPGRIVKFEFAIPLKEKTYVNLFELNGKLVSKNIFEAGKMNFEISLQNSKSGIYSYEILNGEIKLQSGKVYCY